MISESAVCKHWLKDMSVWRVCERAELGKIGRQWELSKGQPLNIGRSSESDIQVQVSSMSDSHSHIS